MAAPGSWDQGKAATRSACRTTGSPGGQGLHASKPPRPTAPWDKSLENARSAPPPGVAAVRGIGADHPHLRPSRPVSRTQAGPRRTAVPARVGVAVCNGVATCRPAARLSAWRYGRQAELLPVGLSYLAAPATYAATIYVACRSRLPRARSYRIVVLGSVAGEAFDIGAADGEQVQGAGAAPAGELAQVQRVGLASQAAVPGQEPSKVLAATLSAHRSAAFGVHVLAVLGGDDAGWRQEFRVCRCRGDRR